MSDEITFCACMGPQYDEPHCYCQMKRLGLALNEKDRAVSREAAEKALDILFGPGGPYASVG